MLTTEQKNQFSEILESLGQTLDVSETQYNAAVRSYEAVGNWLAKEDSPLAQFNPEILPQGSFMLGTMIKPVHEKDDLDIDLVCKLTGKVPSWTQEVLKNMVGDRLKANSTYKEMLKDEGRRCWTLGYSDSANYHLDILPSIVNPGYRLILERVFSVTDIREVDALSIRITDKSSTNYKSEPNHLFWLKSNPFGYGRWFFFQATIDQKNILSLRESIQPVPKYNTNKLPLQRAVQILKRHRDIMFNGDEHKPISIIISTLAAKSYNKETNIFDALINVINSMSSHIEERYSTVHRKNIKWIPNPVNQEENFADKWVDHPKREENFFKWLAAVQNDLQSIFSQSGKGLHMVNESLSKPFGKGVSDQTIGHYSENLRRQRESGLLKMASHTGMIGNVGTNIKNHNFYGKDE